MRFFVFVALSGFLTIQCSRAVAASGAAATSRSFHVGLFFVTDRNAGKKKFGGSRRYLLNCEHLPYYGETYPLLPNTLNEPLTADERASGWTSSKRKHEAVARKSIINVKDSAESEKRFFLRLKKAVEESPKKELYIFVHGYCTNFEIASQKAAELAYFSKQPAVLYSWPSVGKLFSYPADEGNVEWSLEHFRTFISNLAKYQVTESGKINLVAHSIGNRLLIWSGDELVKSPLLKQIVLSSPDVDSETFKHYASRYREQGRANGFVLVSFKDDALPLSQLVHGGYFRLGEGIGSILSLVPNPGDILQLPEKLLSAEDENDSLEKAADKAGLNKVGSNESGSSKDGINDSGVPEASNKSHFNLIDFTEIDKGLLGHSIPSQLIVNLCETGEPGEGLTLAPAVREKNFVAGFSRKAFKLLGARDRTSQKMERVVYVRDLDGNGKPQAR